MKCKSCAEGHLNKMGLIRAQPAPSTGKGQREGGGGGSVEILHGCLSVCKRPRFTVRRRGLWTSSTGTARPCPTPGGRSYILRAIDHRGTGTCQNCRPSPTRFMTYWSQGTFPSVNGRVLAEMRLNLTPLLLTGRLLL